MADVYEVLDEALSRLHHTGPEFAGRLSNHAPMVVEAMVRRGHADDVPRWVDWYSTRLDEAVHPSDGIHAAQWRDALGDPSRLADWMSFFSNELSQSSWNDVLLTWWPRLLPGLAASATHAIIRLGHAVKTIREQGESGERIQEIGQALAYWSARWLPVPNKSPATGKSAPVEALSRLPALGANDDVFATLLERLGRDPRWPAAEASIEPVDDPAVAQAQLVDLVTATTLHYRTHGHGNPIMLVHAATAPNAVLRVLPSLPEEMWVPSTQTAWVASAAIITIYNPEFAGKPTDRGSLGSGPSTTVDLFAQAVAHRDEHAIKFADTAIDVFERTEDTRSIRAAQHAMNLIEPES